ncbi:MAG: NAD+ synthase [Deltaproteobacteria bacterium]
MKVAIAQFNPTVGAVRENGRRILEWLGRARDQQAEVVLFPELCVTGYPARDLLDRPGFVKRVAALTRELVAATPEGVTLIFGSLGEPAGPGLPLTNDAVVAQGGREIARVSKQLLPSYDVFDDARHFRAGPPSACVRIGERTVGVTVCEDAWAESSEMGGRYSVNPVAQLVAQGADLLLNLSASPFTLSKWRRREEIFREVAQRHGLTVVITNQVGANDELIFDGTSVAWSPAGRLLARARSFEEQLLVVDVDRPEPEGLLWPEPPRAVDAAYAALVLGVRDYARKCGFRRAVLGLSGGIDSALTAVIAADALGAQNVLTLALPTRYSSPGSVRDAEALARTLGVRHELMDIDPIFQAYLERLGPMLEGLGPPGPGDVTFENIQARVRGATLMAVSNRTGALVLTTGNKSEIAVGYCTLYGDMVGGLAVISDVPKTMVYQLAELVNQTGERIPRASIDKPPSAELRPDQTDQDSLPAYELLDPILELYVEDHATPEQIVARGYDPEVVRRVVGLVTRAEYKRRQAAPGLILTRKAFGVGRRVPVASQAEDFQP